MKAVCKICGTALYDGFTVSLPKHDQGWLSRLLDRLLPCHHDWLPSQPGAVHE